MTFSEGRQVSNSTGINAPKLFVPKNTCDSHIHIYDSCFPYVGEFVNDATVSDYRLLQQRIGSSRAVVVNPRIYGTNNQVTLDAIQALGPKNARGIAVIAPDTPDVELMRLNEGGICGVRFTLFRAENAPTSFDMVEVVSERVQELGWHLQLHWTAEQIVEHQDLLARLRVPLVFDHIARIPVSVGVNHPALSIVGNMMQEGKAWLKLSGAYLDSIVGPDKNYSDLNEVVRKFANLAPDRLVWGSDWPHPTEMPPKEKPNDSQLMDLLLSWVDDQKMIEKILVSNPQNLYHF